MRCLRGRVRTELRQVEQFLGLVVVFHYDPMAVRIAGSATLFAPPAAPHFAGPSPRSMFAIRTVKRPPVRRPFL
jgi:hypothetical protein